MTDVASEALEVAKEIDPNAPIVQAAEAAVNTVSDLSVSNIVADIELIVKLVNQLKAKLQGVHPNLIDIIKALS